MQASRLQSFPPRIHMPGGEILATLRRDTKCEINSLKVPFLVAGLWEILPWPNLLFLYLPNKSGCQLRIRQENNTESYLYHFSSPSPTPCSSSFPSPPIASR